MTSPGPELGDEARIRALLEDRAMAQSAKDASRFMAAFDQAVVKFDLAPPLREEGTVVLDPAGLQQWLDTFTDVRIEMSGLKITVGGGVAFCHCLQHLQGTRTDGEHEDLWTRSTLGLRKIGGTWKITHEHSSVPIYMDGSDRGALDLQP